MRGEEKEEEEKGRILIGTYSFFLFFFPFKGKRGFFIFCIVGLWCCGLLGCFVVGSFVGR